MPIELSSYKHRSRIYRLLIYFLLKRSHKLNWTDWLLGLNDQSAFKWAEWSNQCDLIRFPNNKI